MRPLQAMMLALIVSPLAGCLPARTGNTAATSASQRPFAIPADSDSVQVLIAVIERPIGDRYLNYGLWDLADEQAVDLERKPILDDNGFRVGLIGGLMPTDLQAMLTSPKWNPDPHQVQMKAGHTTPVVLGPVQSTCQFTLQQDGHAVPVKLTGARCTFEIMATLADESHTTLRFTPILQHGEQRKETRAVHTASGEHCWEIKVQQPSENYTALSWEVTVATNEYLVIGTRLERKNTLGHCFFLQTDSAKPIQRLLVIRTCRPLPDSPDAGKIHGPPPLALQAGWLSARGTAPSRIDSSQ